ncbi:hypothetical protein [Idiomarina sp.]|uniref:hypothetical protein n=1 Tax=Idiomarina sp. TaxID=1874361 RepID=UPI00345D0D7F
MQLDIYLVGGAVRDQLLGCPVGDKDYVVVGATPDQMLALGYQQVGKDFPVFLHPQTREEYALARTERKQGQGYTGFQVNTDTTITLSQDLERRDLTINAIAEDEHGHLIDPYGGQQDIERKLLRHVSPAFVEDPLRVLRVARFYARFKPLGFTVAQETKNLMKAMARSGELKTLVAERVWREWEKALATDAPAAFIELLVEIDAWSQVMPELTIYPSSMSDLHQITQVTQCPHTRFATLMLRQSDSFEIKLFSKRLRLPNQYKRLAQAVFDNRELLLQPSPLSPAQLMELANAADLWRQPERIEQMAHVRHIARPNISDGCIVSALNQARTIDASSIVARGLKGPEVGQALNEERLLAIKRGLI